MRYWLVALLAVSAAAQWPFATSGYTAHGEWSAEILAEAWWSPGVPLTVQARLELLESHWASLTAAGIKVDSAVALVTAERTFDADGHLRLPSDERMSTLLTASGLPIEGGVQGAVTTRYGYPWRTPVDLYQKLPLAQARREDGRIIFSFRLAATIPSDVPPGLYRLRVDFGVGAGTRVYSLNGETFATRSSAKPRTCESHLYTPIIGVNGATATRWVDGSEIRPRVPWVLLNNYNSNGIRGVIAEEDQAHFNLASRNLIQDDIILPLYDATGKIISYSLEPQFPSDTIEARNNIPWNSNSGEIKAVVTAPDGKVTEIGPFPFVGLSGVWPTTKKSLLTAWRPTVYGRYSVRLTGWINDVWGNRYEGGGTYRFWMAKRMTLATATFQGMAYPVGGRYGRDIGFSPPLPADVEVTARMYANSDPKQLREVRYQGKATAGGLFGATEGMISLTFDAPGEYAAHIVARAVDSAGHLWVCSMRHAGVVYPADSPIVARGKQLLIGGKYVERGSTNIEGWVDADQTQHLAHVNFPYRSGDVLLIASEGQGANKIEPVLNWEAKENPAAWETRLNSIGASNLRLRTSNGYSPHLFPEFITERGYYYGAAPRPGFMGRFLVGEDGARAPYWPTSPNSFGGQINASSNGDLPGDIYRLIGGVVLQRPGAAPLYAGYLSSAFLLPAGSKNNRVIAAGSEDVPGPCGKWARFFLVGTRPGMMYQTGGTFAPGIQIDPVLPVQITFTLRYPDGREVTASGPGDSSGSFAGKERWPLDIAGVYRYTLHGEWSGYPGGMPGLPDTGGEFYVVEKDRPTDAPRLEFNVAAESTFAPDQTLTIKGRSTASRVYFAAVIPGSVLAQGFIPVTDGLFEYVLDPRAFNQETPTYDIAHRVTGKAELGDVIHLSFLSAEKGKDGKTWHSFARLIVRGSKVINAQ